MVIFSCATARLYVGRCKQLSSFVGLHHIVIPTGARRAAAGGAEESCRSRPEPRRGRQDPSASLGMTGGVRPRRHLQTSANVNIRHHSSASTTIVIPTGARRAAAGGAEESCRSRPEPRRRRQDPSASLGMTGGVRPRRHLQTSASANVGICKHSSSFVGLHQIVIPTGARRAAAGGAEESCRSRPEPRRGRQDPSASLGMTGGVRPRRHLQTSASANIGSVNNRHHSSASTTIVIPTGARRAAAGGAEESCRSRPEPRRGRQDPSASLGMTGGVRPRRRLQTSASATSASAKHRHV